MTEAAKLPSEELAQVIDALLSKIEVATDPAIDAAWAAESEDRIDAFERGEIAAVDAESAMAQLKRQIGR